MATLMPPMQQLALALEQEQGPVLEPVQELGARLLLSSAGGRTPQPCEMRCCSRSVLQSSCCARWKGSQSLHTMPARQLQRLRLVAEQAPLGLLPQQGPLTGSPSCAVNSLHLWMSCSLVRPPCRRPDSTSGPAASQTCRLDPCPPSPLFNRLQARKRAGSGHSWPSQHCCEASNRTV